MVHGIPNLLIEKFILVYYDRAHENFMRYRVVQISKRADTEGTKSFYEGSEIMDSAT